MPTKTLRLRPRTGNLGQFLLTALIVAGFACFELFYARTTMKAIEMIFGTDAMYTALAVAIVCLDFAGLARIVTHETGKDERQFVKVLFACWVMFAGFSTVLTWWAIQVKLETTPPTYPKVMAEFVEAFPLILAMFSFVIHVLIVYMLGAILDYQMHGKKNPSVSIETPMRVGTVVEHSPATGGIHTRVGGSRKKKPEDARKSGGTSFFSKKPSDTPDELPPWRSIN